MVKNLPANAGDASWIPGCGTKIPHTVEQLSPRTTREALHQGKIPSATAMSQAVAVLSRSVASDSVTPSTAACQAPLSMEFSRQEEDWSGPPCPPPGDFPNPGIKLRSPILQVILYCLSYQGSPRQPTTKQNQKLR